MTPLSVAWHWPLAVSVGLLVALLVLLLVAGQTIIFLLRLVAADRRAGRRRPLTSSTRTVGELEDAATTPPGTAEGYEPAERAETPGRHGPDDAADRPADTSSVRE
jgi:hypothetical protein